MTCKNCDPDLAIPGRIIKTADHGLVCAECGEILEDRKHSYNKWDAYFHTICVAVGTKSPCLSRHIGAILVKDHSIISTGFNGPSRGIPHCGRARYMKDDTLPALPTGAIATIRMDKECPRKVMGYESGTHMELCPAQHAEINAIIDAARKGASTIGTTLYMNCVIPCKSCFGALINAGVVEIVVDKTDVYDKHTQFLIDSSDINIRRFEV